MPTASEAERDVERVGRVRRILAVGRELRAPGTPLGQRARAELLPTCGLSGPGLELALTQHLEASATDEELRAFVSCAATRSACLVVLAANVCTAALRAVAFGLATAPRVFVRPSRRDPALARILADVLHEVVLIDDVAVAALEIDEAHLYGSDAALDAIAHTLPAHIHRLRHGSGMGLALIDEGASLADAASRVAADLVAFDGRGCLSPKVALVQGPRERTESFARALDGELAMFGARVPRGELDAAARAELTRFGGTMSAVGRVFSGSEHLVALDDEPRALLLPPAHRALTVVHASERVDEVVAPWLPFVTCIGADDAARESSLGRRFSASCPRARWAPLGAMQHPPFDGPVDLRAIA